MCNKPVLLASLTLMILTLTGCAKPQPEMVVKPEIPVVEPEGPVIEPEGPVYILNPAEIYCIGPGLRVYNPRTQN